LLELRQIVSIHRKDVIEAIKVGRTDLSRAQGGQINAMLPGSGHGPPIGGLSIMPPRGARRINTQPTDDTLIFAKLPKNALGGGRSANVAETHK